MKKLTLFIFLSFLSSILFSCNMSKEAANNMVMMTIASKKVDCTGVGKMKCLLIKKGDQKDWTFHYFGIKNFNYEEGYEYLIQVRKDSIKNPPADAPSIQYTLVKEISKVKKQSENMPL